MNATVLSRAVSEKVNQALAADGMGQAEEDPVKEETWSLMVVFVATLLITGLESQIQSTPNPGAPEIKDAVAEANKKVEPHQDDMEQANPVWRFSNSARSGGAAAARGAPGKCFHNPCQLRMVLQIGLSIMKARFVTDQELADLRVFLGWDSWQIALSDRVCREAGGLGRWCT